jgi:hypothetical protein
MACNQKCHHFVPDQLIAHFLSSVRIGIEQHHIQQIVHIFGMSLALRNDLITKVPAVVDMLVVLLLAPDASAVFECGSGHAAAGFEKGVEDFGYKRVHLVLVEAVEAVVHLPTAVRCGDGFQLSEADSRHTMQ